MARDFALGLGGVVMLGAGIWRIESRTQRTSAGTGLGMLLCLGGILMIAIMAIQAGSRWSARMGILSTYSVTGAFLGSMTAAAFAKRRAGVILARLGPCVPGGFIVVSAIAAAIGIVSVVAQIIDWQKDAQKPGSLVVVVGQALFFATIGIRTLIMARTRWSLAEQGIIGPDALVPWQHLLNYEWRDPKTLVVTIKPAFGRGRPLRIPVPPDARDSAAAIISSKAPGIISSPKSL